MFSYFYFNINSQKLLFIQLQFYDIMMTILKKSIHKQIPCFNSQIFFSKKLTYQHITIIKNRPKQITRFQAQNKYIESQGHPQIKTYIQFVKNQRANKAKFPDYTSKEEQQRIYKASALGRQTLMIFAQFEPPNLRKDDYQVIESVNVSKMSLLDFLKDSFYFENDLNSFQIPKQQNKKVQSKLLKKQTISNQVKDSELKQIEQQSVYERFQQFYRKLRLLRVPKQHDFLYSFLMLIASIIGSYFVFFRGKQYELVRMNKVMNPQALDYYQIRNVQRSVALFQKRIGFIQAEFYRRINEAKKHNS